MHEGANEPTEDELDSPILPREMIASLREIIEEDILELTSGLLEQGEILHLTEEEGQIVFSLQDLETDEHLKWLTEKIEQNEALERLIRVHWEMEAVGLAEVKPRTASNSEPTPEQWTPAQKAMDDRMKVIYLPEEKKFQLTIPWKDGDKPNSVSYTHLTLPTNREV